MARVNRTLAYSSSNGVNTLSLYVQTEITAVNPVYRYRDVNVSLIALCEGEGDFTFTASEQSSLVVYSISQQLEGSFTLTSGEHTLLTCSLEAVSEQTSESSISTTINFNHSCAALGLTDGFVISEGFPLGKVLSDIDLSPAQDEWYLGDTVYFLDSNLEPGYGAGADIFVNGTQVGTAEIDVSSWSMQTDISWASPYPDSLSGDITVRVYPYCLDTRVYCYKELRLLYRLRPQDCQPEISVTVAPISENTAVRRLGRLIKTKSAVKLTASASGRAGASIVSTQLYFDGTLCNGTEYSSEILSEARSHTWSVTAQDSRGVKSTLNGSFEVLDYAPPQFTASAYRSDAQGNADAGGSYACVQVSTDDAFLYGGANPSSLVYMLTNRDGEVVLQETPIAKSDTPQLLSLGLALGENYRLTVICRDAFGGESRRGFSLDSERVELNISRNAVAVGKYATTENLFDCAWDARINGDIIFNDTNGMPVSIREALSTDLDSVRFKYGAVTSQSEFNALLSQTEQGLFITVISVTAPFGNVPVGKYVYLVYNDAGQSGLIRLNGS